MGRFDNFDDYDMPVRRNGSRGNRQGSSGRGAGSYRGGNSGHRNTRGSHSAYHAGRRVSSQSTMSVGRGGYSHNDRRRRKMRRQVMQTVIPIAIAIVLIAIIGIVAITSGLFEGLGYSDEKADLNEYFNTSSDEEAAVIVEGEVTEERIRVKDGVCYIPLDTVKSEYNKRFYYGEKDGALLYTDADGVICAPVGLNSYTRVTDLLPSEDIPVNEDGSLDYTGNLSGSTTPTDYTTSFVEGDTLFVALDYVKLYANFSYELYGGNGEPYRVEILKQWGSVVLSDIKKDSAVRLEADKKAPILKEVSEGDTVRILNSESEDWMYVMTQDLISGYIPKKYLGDKYEQAQTPVTDVEDVVVPTVADGSDVVLAWHNITTVDAASYLEDYSSYFKYFNTISPTCFYLKDNAGTIESIASRNYVDMAHNAGLKVWGLVENMKYNEVSSYEVLSYSSKRAHVIQQLLNYASEFNLDGINVDFEQLPTEAGEPFIQFVRELSLEAHKRGLVVSVDNYVPKGYTSHYNRQEQGVFADYVIIMGYDEHYSGSTESGSVASLGFVMDGIQQTIAEVPCEKVINAVPFYTRIWAETPKSEAEISQGIGTEGFVNYNLGVQTVSARDAYESVRANGASINWSEESGQNYAEWNRDGKTYKCWLEDGDSMKARMDVMKANNLAGVAVWQLAYSSEDMWNAISIAYPAR